MKFFFSPWIFRRERKNGNICIHILRHSTCDRDRVFNIFRIEDGGAEEEKKIYGTNFRLTQYSTVNYFHFNHIFPVCLPSLHETELERGKWHYRAHWIPVRDVAVIHIEVHKNCMCVWHAYVQHTLARDVEHLCAMLHVWPPLATSVCSLEVLGIFMGAHSSALINSRAWMRIANDCHRMGSVQWNGSTCVIIICHWN